MTKTLVLEFKDLTPLNRSEKFEKAIVAVSKHIGMPVMVEHKHDEKRGEPFIFVSQEDLTVKWYDYFDYATKSVYEFVADYFGLPIQNVVQKAGELMHKGRIIYEPETGRPIKKADWEAFVKALERVVNQRFAGTGKRIILDGQTLGRMLDRMLKYSKLPEVTLTKLSDMKYSGKTYEWISKDVTNIRKVFGSDIREN